MRKQKKAIPVVPAAKVDLPSSTVKKEITQLCDTLTTVTAPKLEEQNEAIIMLMSESTAAKDRLTGELREAHETLVTQIYSLRQKSLDILNKIETCHPDANENLTSIDALIARIETLSSSSVKIIAERDMSKLMQLDKDIAQLQDDINSFQSQEASVNIKSLDINQSKITLDNVKINPAYKYALDRLIALIQDARQKGSSLNQVYEEYQMNQMVPMSTNDKVFNTIESHLRDLETRLNSLFEKIGQQRSEFEKECTQYTTFLSSELRKLDEGEPVAATGKTDPTFPVPEDSPESTFYWLKFHQLEEKCERRINPDFEKLSQLLTDGKDRAEKLHRNISDYTKQLAAGDKSNRDLESDLIKLKEHVNLLRTAVQEWFEQAETVITEDLNGKKSNLDRLRQQITEIETMIADRAQDDCVNELSHLDKLTFDKGKTSTNLIRGLQRKRTERTDLKITLKRTELVKKFAELETFTILNDFL
ncbi:unnamed protein product [Mesocestoides corti]|uniref:Uncharacterized protein n=1 Tax=Mesocestoides corti TaxID=53468 RepID=A0A158QWD0_MESCO|nr:unnamed protein product [Mesocestoides corti]